jgi:hypothetical protein
MKSWSVIVDDVPEPFFFGVKSLETTDFAELFWL